MKKEEIALASKKNFIAFVLTAMLLTSIPIPAGAAAAPELVLDSSVKYAGDMVKLSGTSPYNEVVVKVVRSDETILYIQVVKVSQGKYEDRFTLPVDAMIGDYTVLTGQGSSDAVSRSTFTVKSKSGGGDPGNSSPSGTSSGGDHKPPTTESSLPPVTITDTSISTAIPATAMTVAKVEEDGAAMSRVTVDQGALSKAFQALKGHVNETEKDVIVSISVPREGTRTKVELPVAALKEGQRIVPNAMLSIQSDTSAIMIPIKSVAVSQLETSLGVKASEMLLVVTGQSMPSLLSASERQAMITQGIVMLNVPASFMVTAEAGGKQVKLDHFGDSFIQQKMMLSSKIDSRTATVVVIDPKTHELRFVPAMFQTTGDGGSIASFKSNPNELFMLITSHQTFEDTVGHWAQSSIAHLASKQIVRGVGKQVFDPNGQITRAEFAALLVRSLGLPVPMQTSAFKDVQAGDWFAGAVQTAAVLGLVDGLQDGTFQPQTLVTREQMAVMIERALAHLDARPRAKDVNLASRYGDAGAISGWAKEAMALLVEEKLMEGVAADRIAPKKSATRAEAVMLLERFLQYAKLINE